MHGSLFVEFSHNSCNFMEHLMRISCPLQQESLFEQSIRSIYCISVLVKVASLEFIVPALTTLDNEECFVYF